jgi:hypothetical protein
VVSSHSLNPARINNISRDASDLRDLIYRPSLALLPAKFLCAAVDPRGDYCGILKVRDQHDRPSCIGEALAALIDIQRIESYRNRNDPTNAKKDVHPASAAMLHTMALEIETIEHGKQAREIYSLRSGLKGFYNTGVCTEEFWAAQTKQTRRAEFDVATVETMREARNVTLGAYYRVRSFVNDYHAALLEAGALYVSAELHCGWTSPVAGRIVPGPVTDNNLRSGHAFVIVGYDDDGFLVLNSWGPKWGGYVPKGLSSLPGIALWTYEDWARCVLDAWVLRLAVPTPESFRYTVDQQGAAAYGADQPALASPSVRRQSVLGRYINLDDGRHLRTGSYPSSRRSLETTLNDLRQSGPDSFEAFRITLHGDTTATEVVMARAAHAIPKDKQSRIHGLSVLWVNGLLHGASAALKPLFDAAMAIAMGNRADADRRIELMVGPVGRALWRDVQLSARVAGGPGGDAADAVARIVALCAERSRQLHIVSEGAGSLLLAELLRTALVRRAKPDALASVLGSLTMVAPLNTGQDFNEKIGPFLDRWGAVRGLRATIFKPDRNFHERLSVGDYGRSWTDLVQNALQQEKQILVGAHRFPGPLKGDPRIICLAPPPRRSGDLNSADILQHEDVAKHVSSMIAGGGTAA